MSALPFAESVLPAELRPGLWQALATEPEERFDRLSGLARRLLKVPMVGLVIADERGRWVKSCDGLAASELLHAAAYFGRIAPQEGLFIVPDVLDDRRLVASIGASPLQSIGFYAQAPIRSGPDQYAGAFCILDTAARQVDADDVLMLNELVLLVEHELLATDLAKEDALTGLPNRRGFESLAARALRTARDLGEHVAMIYFDLDGFSRTNSRKGRSEGDRALCLFARHLAELAQPGDVIGRIGGDEFALLLRRAGSSECAAAAARLQQCLSTAISSHALQPALRHSHGTCVRAAGLDGVSVDALLRRSHDSMSQQQHFIPGSGMRIVA